MAKNIQIKERLRRSRIYLYELAAAAGISEPTICRWMRVPLTDDRFARLSAALEKLERRRDNV